MYHRIRLSCVSEGSARLRFSYQLLLLLFNQQAANPQATLLEAHKVCRKLGIDHATIQVHDSKDSRFCYSETCDHESLPEGASGKKKQCV